MKYLLDTHVFLWLGEGSEKVNPLLINEFRNKENEFYLSILSLFEISIKVKIGKLNLGMVFPLFIEKTLRNEIQILGLDTKNCLNFLDMNFMENHKDPFDRMLLTIAKNENLIFVTADQNLIKYDGQVKILKV